MRAQYLFVVLIGLGCSSPSETPWAFSLRPISTSSELPYTASTAMAVLTDGRTCIVATYEVRLVCGDPRWQQLSYFGSEGRGPEEIMPAGELLNMPDGGLAYVDYRNARVTLLARDLKYVRTVRKPALGPPVISSPPDSVLHFSSLSRSPASRPVRSIDLVSGNDVGETLVSLHPEVVGADSIAGYVVLRTPSAYLVRTTGSNLLWVDSGGSRLLGVIPAPDFDPGYPDAIDVENLAGQLRRTFGVVREQDLDRLRRIPREHYPSGFIAHLDRAGRLWVLTNRQDPAGSLFDIYTGTRHLGTVRVLARVAAFRIHDDQMVAITVAPERNADGIYPRYLSVISLPSSF